MFAGLLAIGMSVLLHVSWNLFARHANPRSNFLWWGVGAHLVVLGPWSLWRLIHDAQWAPTLILAIGTTAIANACYFVALRGAYRYAPVALVYPLARSSPLLIAAWSFLFFNQSFSPLGLAGIGVSVAGLLLLGSTARDSAPRRSLPWALMAAFCTSVYSLSDKVAVAYLPSFGSQLGMVSASFLLTFAALSLLNLRETGQVVPVVRPRRRHLVVGGLCIGTSYAFVIHAMQYLPAAYVVTMTNAGLVLATVLSVFTFGERGHWRTRLGAAAVVSIGISFVAIELSR